jgi:hypothetical protein
MNEKRMKTSLDLCEVSLPPGRKAGWGVKVRAKPGCGSEIPASGVGKWLEIPTVGRIIKKTPGKAQFEP